MFPFYFHQITIIVLWNQQVEGFDGQIGNVIVIYNCRLSKHKSSPQLSLRLLSRFKINP